MIRLWLALICCAQIAWAETVPEPNDYRMDGYRGPVPQSLVGATVVGTREAFDLWGRRAVFVDVLPRAPKPPNLPEGTIWRDKPRLSIPEALWLPNVGYGALAEVTADYFRRGLEMATDGDTTKPVVFFCLSECWMSWNAAKRAVSWGYEAVYWFPDGTDGWSARGFPMVEITPLEPQPQASEHATTPDR